MRKIFAIADLHLGFSLDKPMEIFGEAWIRHHQKIKEDWLSRVGAEDVVIVAGDISWGMRLEESLVDLEWIDALPGRKVLVKGNHDYWWQSLSQIQGRFDTIHFLYNNMYAVGDLAICGTRGWLLPTTEEYRPEDEKIYRREVMRLERSLLLAKEDPRIKRKMVAMHYPPLSKYSPDNGFVQAMKEHDVQDVVYGHLHDRESWNQAILGQHQGMVFHLVACDFLNFRLKEIAHVSER
ncbi:MAG TPA: serine/threonine protein phosphatase [Tissierellia bacterium]|nr:serine/threonine protein phosphatase [Tissierellia bacterium]